MLPSNASQTTSIEQNQLAAAEKNTLEQRVWWSSLWSAISVLVLAVTYFVEVDTQAQQADRPIVRVVFAFYIISLILVTVCGFAGAKWHNRFLILLFIVGELLVGFFAVVMVIVVACRTKINTYGVYSGLLMVRGVIAMSSAYRGWQLYQFLLAEARKGAQTAQASNQQVNAALQHTLEQRVIWSSILNLVTVGVLLGTFVAEVYLPNSDWSDRALTTVIVAIYLFTMLLVQIAGLLGGCRHQRFLVLLFIVGECIICLFSGVMALLVALRQDVSKMGAFAGVMLVRSFFAGRAAYRGFDLYQLMENEALRLPLNATGRDLQLA